jgi:nicotinate-nucleotide adenylyltransferase
LILLIGADAFAALPTWHEWRSLFDLAHVAVLTRPGHEAKPPAELAAVVGPRRAAEASCVHESASGRVLDLAVTSLEISASAIRDLLASGEEPRWLVPDSFLVRPELLAPYRRISAS